MIRRIIAIACCAALFCAFGTVAHAATYTPYDGTISSTYLTYAKDIIPNIGLKDHYVFVRSGQNEYKLIVGDVVYSSGIFSNIDPCTVYTFSSDGSYNSYYSYNVSTLDDFTLNPGDKIVYSDLGNFPQLEERGQKYEVLQTIILCIFMLCIVVRSIFFTRKR